MFIRWILSIILNAVALIIVAELFDSFHLEGFGTAVLASIILGILNVIVRPILIILTLSITILSLGLFLFISNAITLMITQAVMDSSFVIDSFGMAIIASIIISLINLVLNRVVKDTVRYS